MKEELLTGGFTANILQRIGDKVIKTGETVQREAKWYMNYRDREDIPKFLGSSITLEFVETSGKFDLRKVIALVEKYRQYQPLNKTEFKSYYERILSHVEKNDIPNSDKLISKLRGVHLTPTFAHGDLSTKNILWRNGNPILIDPLYCDNFGSYMLDYAKLLFSLKFYENDVENFNELHDYVQFPQIDILIASECVRVATYRKQFNFVAENLINEL